ncbi:hypothetical protein [Zobellella denitrificans]|uniref:hypothetical protein n=1 Tax=Zobellella denitrificans TaxID=347534 RepID=UPI000BBE469A|nr:hypothetical protein [Zobellella denitrificans]
MFQVDNNSAVATMPPLAAAGSPGWFTAGAPGVPPTYPGPEWFNIIQAELLSVLTAAGVAPDKTKLNQLATAIQAIAGATGQFAPYSATRTYSTGETCTTLVDGELRIWEMYAGPDMTCVGKDPNDPANRHDGWLLDSAPWWWIPYGNVPGRPSWWLAETAPERAVMEMGQDLPTAVYWRLARQYPHLVTGANINTGDIRGEFLRVWDNGRGVDPSRAINSYQEGTHITGDNGVAPAAQGIGNLSQCHVDSPDGSVRTIYYVGSPTTSNSASPDMWGRVRPRSIARAMIIEI